MNVKVADVAVTYARLMAKFIRKNGFDASYKLPGSNCGCFIHAAGAVRHQVIEKHFPDEGPGQYLSFDSKDILDSAENRVLNKVNRVSGAEDLGEYALQRAGFASKAATRDASAVCEVVGDLLTRRQA